MNNLNFTLIPLSCGVNRSVTILKKGGAPVLRDNF